MDTPIAGLKMIEPQVFVDERGYFLETFNAEKFAAAGLPTNWVQDNHSHSVHGVLRGLHYQLRRPQGKLVRVVQGEVFDVAVDIRRGSPTFGQWFGTLLSATNYAMLLLPPGLAHGFCVISPTADVLYKCTDVYVPNDDRGVLWSDPALSIEWPVDEPVLSPKDQRLPRFDPDSDDLPTFVPQ
jgi:dTDP-4-dehydrorhamnose 3,5-epimerase